MKPTPAGWPRFSSAIVYRDAAAAIDWLCDAFGFEIRIKVEGENGRIEHCELEYGDGLVMIAQESPDRHAPLEAISAQPALARGREHAKPHVLRGRCRRPLRPRPLARRPHHRGAHDPRLRRGTLGGPKLRRARPGRARLVGGAAGALCARLGPRRISMPRSCRALGRDAPRYDPRPAAQADDAPASWPATWP